MGKRRSPAPRSWSVLSFVVKQWNDIKLHNFVLGGLVYAPKENIKSPAQRMPKLNSLLEFEIFLAAVVFCHDKCMPQKDCVRETLARAETDLSFELFK